ncbi:hypothetical protein AC1031_019021 [Aphanomyces cochlioides]|nr:hypothetical protein AC1031_019021 [Aphanomyces cochlioides]
MSEKSVAVWTTSMEMQLLSAFQKYAAMPKYVAAGGKNLRESGWQCVLKEMQDLGIDKTSQLESKWRRMKIDFSDLTFLMNLSGFGEGFSNDKWEELDQSRGKIKFSRFKDKPFLHYEAMASIIGDTMATGENIRPVAAASNDEETELQQPTTSQNLDHGDLTAAERRAKVLHQLKQNKKKKRDEAQNLASNKRLKIMEKLTNSVADLVKLYAMKNGLEPPSTRADCENSESDAE